MSKLHELLQKRNALVVEGRAITDKALNEKRGMTAEENQTYDRIHSEIAALDETRAKVEKQTEVERATAAAVEQIDENTSANPADAKRMADFRHFLVTGEKRNLQADADTKGGFLKAPQTFVAELIKAVDNLVFVRQKARVLPLNATDSLGVPTLATDFADLAWTAEVGTTSEDTTMGFGKRELKPHKLSKRIKVSNALMRLSALPVESIVIERASYKNGTTQENCFLNGSGAGQPLGMFTASNDGIPTSRDYSTGNTSTAMTFDGLIGTKYSVKSQYHGKAEWVFHRDAVAQIAKLKDSQNQYIWQPSKTLADPDMLLGRPINISEYAPNTFTTGLYVGLFGDMSNYWIADSLDMQVQRLAELYAETDETGFIFRSWTDGAPVLGEAFARVKLA